MSKILLTGIATLDIINHLDHYPQEDEEVRASAQELRRGGNAANTASVLSQLGYNCQLACTLADDMAGQFILSELQRQQIQFDTGCILANSTTPTSYITLNTQNGSRTIVHYRNLEELSFSQFDRIDLDGIDWFHFEARNVEQTLLMMRKAQAQSKTISIEAEKPRDNIEQLFPLADVIMISKPFAEANGFDSAKGCLEWFTEIHPNKLVSCTWGDQGAYGFQHGQTIHQSAFPPEKIIDTIGAGDTFNAGFIHSLIKGSDLQQALNFACRLAGKKCGQYGFEQLGTIND